MCSCESLLDISTLTQLIDCYRSTMTWLRCIQHNLAMRKSSEYMSSAAQCPASHRHACNKFAVLGHNSYGYQKYSWLMMFNIVREYTHCRAARLKGVGNTSHKLQTLSSQRTMQDTGGIKHIYAATWPSRRHVMLTWKGAPLHQWLVCKQTEFTYLQPECLLSPHAASMQDCHLATACQ